MVTDVLGRVLTFGDVLIDRPCDIRPTVQGWDMLRCDFVVGRHLPSWPSVPLLPSVLGGGHVSYDDGTEGWDVLLVINAKVGSSYSWLFCSG